MAAEVAELTASGEAGHDFGELNVERLRRFVVNRQGQDFLLYAGLVSALHAVSDGYFAIDTRIEQLPTAENGQTAVCSARVQVFDYDRPDVVRRVASGIGDASPANVSKPMANATIRLAETRAKGRALRDLLGIDLVTFEELGADDARESPQAPQNARPASFSAPAVRAPVESIQVAGRTLNRAQVLEVYDARLAQAAEANLQLAPMGAPGGPPPRTAPLPEIVAFCQAILRRLDARSGAVHTSAK